MKCMQIWYNGSTRKTTQYAVEDIWNSPSCRAGRVKIYNHMGGVTDPVPGFTCVAIGRSHFLVAPAVSSPMFTNWFLSNWETNPVWLKQSFSWLRTMDRSFPKRWLSSRLIPSNTTRSATFGIRLREERAE